MVNFESRWKLVKEKLLLKKLSFGRTGSIASTQSVFLRIVYLRRFRTSCSGSSKRHYFRPCELRTSFNAICVEAPSVGQLRESWNRQLASGLGKEDAASMSFLLQHSLQTTNPEWHFLHSDCSSCSQLF
jgi:hypothetical protein